MTRRAVTWQHIISIALVFYDGNNPGWGLCTKDKTSRLRQGHPCPDLSQVLDGRRRGAGEPRTVKASGWILTGRPTTLMVFGVNFPELFMEERIGGLSLSPCSCNSIPPLPVQLKCAYCCKLPSLPSCRGGGGAERRPSTNIFLIMCDSDEEHR